MKRTAALELLQQYRAELARLGVVSLSLIGSTARDEATEDSDVDVAVRLTPGARGFKHLERLDRLRDKLAVILGIAVDVVEEPSARPRLQQAIERDRVIAF